MSEVLNLFSNEATLAGLKLQACITQSLDHLMKVLKVLLKGAGEHKNIVDVNSHIVWSIVRVQSAQDILHEALENSRSFGESEWNDPELIEALWCDKGRLLNGVRMHGYLPIAGNQVKCAEVTGSSQLIQEIIDPG